jgi:hypothetical protein
MPRDNYQACSVNSVFQNISVLPAKAGIQLSPKRLSKFISHQRNLGHSFRGNDGKIKIYELNSKKYFNVTNHKRSLIKFSIAKPIADYLFLLDFQFHSVKNE